MLTKNEITIKLKELGFEERGIDTVIVDVLQIILSKAVSGYFSELPESNRSELKGLSGEQVMEYIGSHKETFPEFSNQEFAKIYDDTWEDYFSILAK